MDLDRDDDDLQLEALTLPFDRASEAALNAAAPSWMPWRSLALYARWWQLESWLRDLAYVELRTQYGTAWDDRVKEAVPRQEQDAAFRHMTGRDSDNTLAYLDYSNLLNVINRDWQIFEYALLEQRSWDGRQEELKRIRHRVAHVRHPHHDDLNRIEQTLRDLEAGAFRASASYNRQIIPDLGIEEDDPAVRGWIQREHPTAERLIDHADSQYETNLRVCASKRPWGQWRDTVAASTGLLWHANFYLRGDGRIDVRQLWTDLAIIRDLIVHVLVEPWEVRFTFSGADDRQSVSDAIGEAFDAVLYASRSGLSFDVRNPFDHRQRAAWAEKANAIDFRLQSGSLWSIVDDSTIPISIFTAGGGGVLSPPPA